MRNNKMTIEVKNDSISINNIPLSLKQSPTKLYQKALDNSYSRLWHNHFDL